MNRKRVRALIVDDSASVRQTPSGILNEDPDIEVIGMAADPTAAARRIRAHRRSAWLRLDDP